MSIYLDQLTGAQGVLFRALTSRSYFLWEGGYKPISTQVTYLKYTQDAVRVKLSEKVLTAIRRYRQEVEETSLKEVHTLQKFLILLQDEGALNEEDVERVQAQFTPKKVEKVSEVKRGGFLPFLLVATVVPVLIDHTLKWLF